MSAPACRIQCLRFIDVFFVFITTRSFLLSLAKRPTVVLVEACVPTTCACHSTLCFPVKQHDNRIPTRKQPEHFNVPSLDRNLIGIRSIIYGCTVCPNTRPRPCRGWSVLWQQPAGTPASSRDDDDDTGRKGWHHVGSYERQGTVTSLNTSSYSWVSQSIES